MDGQRLFLDNLGTIDRVISAVARRYRLSAQEHDELRSLVRLRLVEDDARVLRAFENRSTLSTYLTIVTTRIFLDSRNQDWGRWRPSAQARRLGSVAVLLERLMTRDGHPIEEAIEILRTNHKVAMSDTEIHALRDAIPRRQPTTLVSEEAALDVVALGTSERDLEFAAAATRRARVGDVLARALAALETRDRLIVQLHFQHGVRVPDLAAHFQVSKATLHRQINRILSQLRDAFHAAHLDAQEISEALQAGGLELSELFDSSGETVLRRARLFNRDE